MDEGFSGDPMNEGAQLTLTTRGDGDPEEGDDSSDDGGNGSEGGNGSGGESGSSRQDYGIAYDTTSKRPRVEYGNEVDPEAMRTVTVTKAVYDKDGETRLNTDAVNAEFAFRLYLGNEFAGSDTDLALADMYTYYVKNDDNTYCRWDKPTQKFIPLKLNGQDVKTHDALMELKQQDSDAVRSATFTTSMYGTIARIPANYTVEVRDLIVGTKYKVEEWDRDIPKGYTRRDRDGYVRLDLEEEEEGQSTPISDTIESNESPQIEIRNQKGWGLTAKKVWTDADFMVHDDIYLAVYVRITDEHGQTQEVLQRDTVRRLKNGQTEAYYFFPDLRDQDDPNVTHLFSDYVIREVTLDGLVVNEETDEFTYTNVRPISGEDNTLTIGGTPVGGNHQDGYTYMVSYDVGDSTGQNEMIRTETVTNSRPGIEIFKKNMTGDPLASSVFTLKDDDGVDVAASHYVSGEDGKVTTAYLSDGTYYLTETVASKGYIAPDEPLTITVDNGAVSISPDQTSAATGVYAIDNNPGGGMTASITVKNRESSLQVKKVDSESGDPIGGVHFSLYRQTSTGGKPLQPMDGYEDIVTNANGVLAEVTQNLRSGTYYLTEKQAAEGYGKLEGDLCFTIGSNGAITIESDEHEGWLEKTVDETTGRVSHVIAIPNSKSKKVSFKKVDVTNMDNSALEGAEFALYQGSTISDGQQPMISGLVSGEDGLLAKENRTVFDLSIGTYCLKETKAPEGYLLPDAPIVISVTVNGVTALQANNNSPIVAPTGNNNSWLIKVWNTPGVELPNTGGSGVMVWHFVGALLALCAVAILFYMRKSRRSVS